MVDIISKTIVHLLRLLKLFAKTVMSTFNLWKEEGGKQQLKLVVSNYLEGSSFQEIVLNPEWKHLGQFNPTILPSFNAEGMCLIEQPSLGLWWEHIQKNPALCRWLYFGKTSQNQNEGIGNRSMVLPSAGHCWQAACAMRGRGSSGGMSAPARSVLQ